MLANELPRMQKVNANWSLYIGTWVSLLVVGLVLRFGLKADWAHGLGPALMLIGAMGFLIDGFAERRARPYTQALDALAAEHQP
jgi:lipoprotein signal peptidase